MRLCLLISLLFTSLLLSGQEVMVTISCQEDWPPAKAVPVTITLQNVPAGVFARLHQTFPLGFSVRQAEAAGADFFRDNNQVNFVWLDFPDASVVQVQYLVTPHESMSGSFRLSGILDYIGSDGETRYTADITPKLIRLDPGAVIVPAESLRRVTKRVGQAEGKEIAEEKVEDSMSVVKKRSDNSVKYRVQVAISSLQLTREELEDRVGFPLRHGMTMLRAANLYKYQSGSFEKYREASGYLEELKKGGVKDAFIVAYRGDEQIPVDIARSMEK